MKKPIAFSHLKPFDIIPVSEYVRLEDRAFEDVLSNFKVNTICFVDNATCEEGVDRTQSRVYKALPPKAVSSSFRPNYYVSDNKGIQTLFHRQAETRRVHMNQQLVYIEFPLQLLHRYVKKVFTFDTNFEIIDSFLKQMNEIGWVGTKFVELREKFDETFSKGIPASSDKFWNFDTFIELHYFYKTYGFLTLPVIDKHPEYFKGSTHTFFHLNYLKADHIPIFIPIPEGHNQVYKTNWYGYISPQSMDNEHGYVFYIDMLERSIYGKVYGGENVENLISLIRNNRLEDDFYKNLQRIV